MEIYERVLGTTIRGIEDYTTGPTGESRPETSLKAWR